jgi:hypothetical protein
MVKHKLSEWEGICVPNLAALTDFFTEQNDDVQYMLKGQLHDREWTIYVSYLKLNHDFASCVLQLAHLSSVRIIEHRNREGALRSDRGLNAGRFISILLDTFSSTVHVAEICVHLI